MDTRIELLFLNEEDMIKAGVAHKDAEKKLEAK